MAQTLEDELAEALRSLIPLAEEEAASLHHEEHTKREELGATEALMSCAAARAVLRKYDTRPKT